MKSQSRRQFLGLGLTALVTPLSRTVRSGVNGRDSINGTRNINDLVEQTFAFLESLNARQLDPFLANWPRSRELRESVPASLPVVRWLSQVKANTPASTTMLVGELSRIAGSLNWRQTYRQPAVTAQFLANYGYTELAGLAGPVPSKRLACGFLLLGPDTTYPRHSHEAEEIYVPLSGTAAWEHGDRQWRNEQPGTVIHHASNEPHAMRTGSDPLLALYLWRSDDLNQKSHLA